MFAAVNSIGRDSRIWREVLSVGSPHYDGMNRRLRCDSDSQSRPGGSPDGVDTYQHCYFNTGWQMLDTRRTGTSSAEPENIQPECQYMWSNRCMECGDTKGVYIQAGVGQ